MTEGIRSWLRSLDLPQRRWLAGLSCLVVLAALALGVAVVGGGGDRGDDTVALETEGDDGRRTSSSLGADHGTAAPTTTSTEPDGAAPPGTVSSTTAAGGRGATTTRPRRGTTGSTTAPARGGTAPPAIGTPSSTPTSTSSSTSTSSAATQVTRDGGVEDRIAERFVAHRTAAGRAAMTRTIRMDEVAADWARHMAERGRISHQPEATIEAACPSACHSAENVAQNHNADDTWTAWLASPTHFANIDHPAGGFYGVGAYRTPDGRVWVVHVFGRTPG